MSDDGSELALLQARLSSLERDLAASGRRLEAKEEELRVEKATHAKQVRELEQREAVLEGKLSIAEHEVARLQTAVAAHAAATHAPPHTPTSTSHAASSANQGGRRVPPIPGTLTTDGKPAVSITLPTSPVPAQPVLPTLPLRPLLPVRITLQRHFDTPPPSARNRQAQCAHMANCRCSTNRLVSSNRSLCVPFRFLPFCLVHAVPCCARGMQYSEDSPFFRREEAVFADKVTHLSTRLKKVVVKAKEFSLATQKQAETAAALSAELGGSWSDVEGGLDAIIAAAAHTQASQGGGGGGEHHGAGGATSPSSAPTASAASARTRSSIIQSEELVSLSFAFGKLGSMLSTVSDIGTNLSVSVDAFLVSALVDFRTQHIQTLLDQELALKKSMEDYEAAFVRRLNKKREKSLFGSVTGVVTEKARKKAAQEEEEVRALVLQCSMLRKNYELQRFDYVTLLNEVLLERRMELIEMVCASFLGFITFFHEGNYVADTIKKEVDQCNRHINIKRPMFLKSGEGIREQRIVVEKALELPLAAVNASAAAAAGAASPSGALSPTAASAAALEKALQWKVHDAFPTSSTASGMLSPAAQAQQEAGLVTVTVASTSPGGAPRTVPSPYAHASIRGNMVPIEKEGYLRKQSSSLKKDWKKRWFILQNGQLFYVRDSDNLQPTFVQNVLLCTVRLSQKSELDLCFDLISPNKRVYTLQAETEAQRAEWMAVFQNCSESLLNSSGTMLTAAEQGMSSTQLREHNENKASATQSLRTLNPVCVDCGAKGENSAHTCQQQAYKLLFCRCMRTLSWNGFCAHSHLSLCSAFAITIAVRVCQTRTGHASIWAS